MELFRYFLIIILSSTCLYHLVNSQFLALCPMHEILLDDKDHYYVCNRTTADEVSSQPNNKRTGVVAGQFSIYPNATCGGELMRFVALYELYLNDPITNVRDHFYTQDTSQVDMAKFLFRYEKIGIAGYCAPTMNYCGAFVPFRRMFNPSTGDHFYTTSTAKYYNNPGYLGEGIECYVW